LLASLIITATLRGFTALVELPAKHDIYHHPSVSWHSGSTYHKLFTIWCYQHSSFLTVI